jgi:uncharacterized phage protein (TIGR02218 family)
MKSLSSALTAHLAGFELTLATCWKATRNDGTVFGFTDHDSDLVVGGLRYEAATGFTRSALHTSSTLAVDNLTLDSALNSERITDDDLRAGAWDGAAIEVFLVNWTDPDGGVIMLKRGTVGQVQISQPGYAAELRGLTQAAQQQVIELYSPGCRAELGDGRCRIDLDALTRTGTVDAVLGRDRFTDAGRSEAAGTWAGGLLSWVTGANTGQVMEVGESAVGDLTLYLPMANPIEPGDRYTVSPGCDRSFATCRDRFRNGVNFRGEHLLPGTDQIFLYPNGK